MADVMFLALIAGLFALAVLLVVGCDRLIGPAEELQDATTDREDRIAA